MRDQGCGTGMFSRSDALDANRTNVSHETFGSEDRVGARDATESSVLGGAIVRTPGVAECAEDILGRCGGAERAYRAAVLRDIERRIRADGPYCARPHADRARQFMPFAALKGYHEMARAREFSPEPRCAIAEDEAAELSRTVARLAKGDVARVVHYERDGYVTTCGAVSEVVTLLRRLRIVKKWIAFDDIRSIEVMER